MIPLLVCLFTCYQNVQTLTDQLTELGQHVTINCDLEEVDEVYWLLLNLPNPPTTILRSFSTSQTPFYYKMTFRHKYSVQSKHLLINSVTVDELGVYFCMNTGIFPTFSDGIRLHVIEPTQLTEFTECQNHTIVSYIQSNHTVAKHTEQNQTQWMTIIIISGVLTGVLVFVAIGITCQYTREDQNVVSQHTRFTSLKQLEELKSCTLCTEVVFSSVCDESDHRFFALPPTHNYLK